MKKKVLGFVATISLLVIAVVFYAQTGASQAGPGEIPSDAQELASKILGSPAAEYLSGSGLNALLLLSGRVAAPPAEISGSVPQAFPFVLSPSEVMVNDPSRDTLTDFDISTQSETAVAGFGPNVVVAFNDSGQVLMTRSIMGYGSSRDGGGSFTHRTLLPSPTGLNLGDPALVASTFGNFYAAAIAFDPSLPPPLRNTISVQKSTDGGSTFGPPVYLPVPPFSFQDKEFMAIDKGVSEFGVRLEGNIYLSWTSFGGGPGLPIFFSRSTDAGASFSTPFQISPAGTINQGSEPAVGPQGEVYVAWYRILPPPSSILVAKSTNAGLSFGPPVVVTPVTPIGFGARLFASFGGNLFGNFRMNSFPRIAVNPVNGDVYIVYASNPAVRAGQPPSPDGADVFFTRSTDGGATWSAPIRVNDDVTTNDQFFPAIAVNGKGEILVVWYDRRNDPNNLRIDVFSARSMDGGLTFSANERVTSVSSLPAVGYDPVISRTYMGDYIDVKSDLGPFGRGTDFLTAWGDFRRMIITLGGRRPDQDVIFSRVR